MRTKLIAEMGINHNGNLEIAKRMIKAAKDVGVGIVKFQKRTIDLVYSEEELTKYRESPWGTTVREQKEGLEFGKDEYDAIDVYCKELGIDWTASAWDLESQKFLQQYDLKYNKIASPMLTNQELLDMVSKEGKKTFISTGMSTWDQITNAFDTFSTAGCGCECPFVLMHCVSVYPCPPELINLRMIESLIYKYGCEVGYSGHEVGIDTTVAAVALGATVIERHFTLDRSMYGSDQAASLEVGGWQRLVKYVKTLELALGDGTKDILEAEKSALVKLRKIDSVDYSLYENIIPY